MAIKLFDFQKEAVKKAMSLRNMLLCVRVGGGKTMIAMVYAKNLLKKNLTDKVIFACTVSAAVAVRGEFKEKGGVDLPQYEKVDDLLDWINSDKKICVIKHSMFEKLGYDQNVINELRHIWEEKELRVTLIVDEAHKIGNDTSIANSALMNIKFFFDRMLLMTATPYQSCVSQMYGLISLINPTLWKNRTQFRRMYIEEKTIMVNGKVARKEKVAYRNLLDLRKKIEPFTFFYYPKIKLNFIQHNVVLKDYSDYDEICKGVLTAKELDKLNEKEKK